MADTLTCPDCGGTATRDRRFLTEGHTPFICRRAEGGCGAWIVQRVQADYLALNFRHVDALEGQQL